MAACLVKIDFFVPDLAEVLTLYDVVRVYRSTTGRTGTYTEVTTASTRLPLVAGEQHYPYVDSSGQDGYWYRIDYFNTATSVASPQCDAIQGTNDPALQIISADELREEYLHGVNFLDGDGNDLPDSVLEKHIRRSVSRAETQLDLPLRPRSYDSDATAEPTERLDFFRQDWWQYISLQLDHYPVIAVSEVKLILPTEQEVIDFDVSWFNLERSKGQLNIIPGQGRAGVVALGATGAWIPLMHRGTDFIPHTFRVKYTAGFANSNLDNEFPEMLRDYVGKLAAIQLLHIAGDLVLGPGIASESINLDGVGQTVNSTASAMYAGYSARINGYRQELRSMKKEIRNFHKGLMMVVA